MAVGADSAEDFLAAIARVLMVAVDGLMSGAPGSCATVPLGWLLHRSWAGRRADASGRRARLRTVLVDEV